MLVKILPAFIAGAAIGAVGGWYIAKKKYEEIANAERKERLERRNTYTSDDLKEETAEESDEYKKKVADLGYSGDSKSVDTIRKDEAREEAKEWGYEVDEPYIIEPEEYGEIDGYTMIDLTYFADGILTDDDFDIVDDVFIVGEENLDKIGEYEDDVIHIRNDKRKCDYQVVADPRRYYGEIRPED